MTWTITLFTQKYFRKCYCEENYKVSYCWLSHTGSVRVSYEYCCWNMRIGGRTYISPLSQAFINEQPWGYQKSTHKTHTHTHTHTHTQWKAGLTRSQEKLDPFTHTNITFIFCHASVYLLLCNIFFTMQFQTLIEQYMHPVLYKRFDLTYYTTLH